MFNKEIIIWDNDGTIMGTIDPHDTKRGSRVILPNVEHIMTTSKALHVVCSGCKTATSELQNFNAENIIKRFTVLMSQLPIAAATFSPAIGGTECWVILKNNNEIHIRKAHKEPRYHHLIGTFKKPEIGMLTVIRDLLRKEFNVVIKSSNSLFIGDSWHDKQAATSAEIPFLEATHIHTMNIT